MWSWLCCIKLSKKVQRGHGVRHDPSKHGHFRAGASPGVYRRRKVSRMDGTISAEDVSDDGKQRVRSPFGSDRSDISDISGRNSPAGVNNFTLTVPSAGGKRPFITPQIAASTPDLRKALEIELAAQKNITISSLSNKNLQTTWLSSQSISNLSISNYENNIISNSRAGSNASSIGMDRNKSEDLRDMAEKVPELTNSAQDLSEIKDTTVKKKKKDFLSIPFMHSKNKKTSSNPDMNKLNVGMKDDRKGGSTFYLAADEEKGGEGVALAHQFGFDLEMYKSEQQPQLMTSLLTEPEFNKATDLHIEYNFGTVTFSTFFKNGSLSVSLKKLQGLPFKGTKPLQYSVLVKMHIWPENKKNPIRVAGANVEKKSPNPSFDEDFHFANLTTLADKTLCISVFEKGREGNYDAIGHSLIDLATAKLSEQPKLFSKFLRNASQPSNNKGSIQLSLNYSPQSREIEIHAYSAKDLHLANFKEEVSTFVKASFYCKGKKEKSKKSAVAAKDKNPLYNHSFQLNVPSAALTDSLVVVSVVHKPGKLSQEQLVGKVLFGPYCTLGGRQTDWGAILKGQKITQWYDLQYI